MKRIMLVFGTRPEAIKMCPLIKVLKATNEYEPVVVISGQHREMLKQVMDFFEINADYDLNIMRTNQSLSDITCAVLTGVEQIIQKIRPDMILVHGDTTTSYAAALAAFYNRIPLGHVEAGLRTYDIRAPYPEEMNRQFVDLVSDIFFAPTDNAKLNLLKENKTKDSIYVTGNTSIDAMRYTVRDEYNDDELMWAADSKMILMTVHRRENWGKPLDDIFRAVNDLVLKRKDIKVIFPVHKNPIVREAAKKYLAGNDRIHLIEPLDVVDFQNYMKKAYIVITDSGGIQEEAPALGKPVLVLRDKTERPEGVEAGTLKLVGTAYNNIIKETEVLLDNEIVYEGMANSVNPYGDGYASEKILSAIDDMLKQESKK